MREERFVCTGPVAVDDLQRYTVERVGEVLPREFAPLLPGERRGLAPYDFEDFGRVPAAVERAVQNRLVEATTVAPLVARGDGERAGLEVLHAAPLRVGV